MTASDNLSAAQQFPEMYHGTSAALTVGDVIEPRRDYRGVGKVAFASVSPGYAKHMASRIKETPGQQTLFGTVYKVEPLSEKPSTFTQEDFTPEAQRNRTSKDDIPMVTHYVDQKGFRITGVAGYSVGNA